MFGKKQSTKLSSRTRQPSHTLSKSFRRNTVVISRSQREMAARQQSVTERQLDHQRAMQKRRFRFRLLFGSLLAIATLSFWQQRISSVSIVIDRPYRLTNDEAAHYEASLARLYPEYTAFNQAWLLDDQALGAAMQARHPEVASVQLSTGSAAQARLKAQLTFRRPVFVWRDLTKAEQFVDSKGVLFTKNFDKTIDIKKLVQIEDESGVVLEAGNSVLTAALVTFVGRLHTELPRLYENKAVARVVIPRSTREVQAQITGLPYLIKFSSTRSFDEQIGELASLRSYLQRENINPVSHIDVRLSDKAFFK